MILSHDPIQNVIDRLPGAKKSGTGWAARCPAHDDHNASLSITSGDDGRVLLHCHAGCITESIVAAVGLTMADLFPEKVNGNGHTTRKQIVATYDYCDKEGELLYQAVRYQPKDFRQRRPDGEGGWIWNLQGVKRVLYRFPELLNERDDRPGEWRFIVEGEKDADALRKVGLIATCNVGGACKWKDEYSDVLTCEKVAIIADKDAPGRAHAHQVATSLQGKAVEVRVVEMPGDGIKDAADYLAAGGSAEKIIEMVEKASAWSAQAPRDADDVPTEAPILDPRDPMPGARSFVADQYHDGEHQLLLHHQGEFRAWKDSAYGVVDENAMRSNLWKFTENAKRRPDTREGDGDASKLLPYQPTSAKISNLLDALKGVVNAPDSITAPAWLKHHEWIPSDVVAHRTGLLHLPTLKQIPPTPSFYTHNALPFAYDPAAPLPIKFVQFLRDVLIDEPSISTLQELFGYLLTPDTRQQKIFFLVGPKRSGKGTIARIVRALLGEANVCGPTLSGMSGPFGLQCLIGKLATIISDARLGGRNDTVAITERLLAISGEDAISVERKYLPVWTGKLPTRFIICTNELPRLTDASGALASRLVIIETKRSYFGQEDTDLTTKLLTELPGILNWAIEGHHRLAQRGAFVQPDTSRHLIQDMEDLASPVAAFVREVCIVSPSRRVERGELYNAWKAWCEREGRDHPGTAATFGRELSAAIPSVRTAQHRTNDGRRRFYEGIDIRNANDEEQA